MTHKDTTPETRTIFCTGCGKDVQARLTNGEERYPHRPDLYDLPFWKCDTCGNYVGCHHKTSKPTTPLGCIATPEILEARKAIHALIDPLWKSGEVPRPKLYAYISKQLGHQYHTGEIRSIEEARKVWQPTMRRYTSKDDARTVNPVPSGWLGALPSRRTN